MVEHTEQNAFSVRRQRMVEGQIALRGVHSSLVLDAMRAVPRELFLPRSMGAFAYEDRPLPIGEGQTISQPFIVAYMLDALQLRGIERVLEIGAGSGYSAALLGEIAGQVYSIERHKSLASRARQVLGRLRYSNVEVIDGDGSLGFAERAPYDAIVVTAGGPSVPKALKEQLAVGGRLVMPVGPSQSGQALVRITRIDDEVFREEHLTDVHFVPLVGEQGWQETETRSVAKQASALSNKRSAGPDLRTSELIAQQAEAIDDLDTTNLDSLLERVGDAKIVLIGEASHGTSEFYRLRARITQELIKKKGFTGVAVEADWPDASRIDDYVRHKDVPASKWTAFTRFPSWMWRNEEVREFVDWLHEHNSEIEDSEQRVGFYGLDLYSLFTSIEAVLDYLDDVDPQAAEVARERYGCLTPWQADPATYGRAASSGRYRECESDVVAMLMELLNKRLEYTPHDGARFMDAVQNARLVTNAERYYRSMYSGYSDSWNLRDQHMFDTLQALVEYGGENAKIVVWEHNSHIGDAKATDMSVRGQHNVGQLCREAYGSGAYIIGFGTHTGTVAAATDWGGEMEVKDVRPSLPGSWEHICHHTDIPAFVLHLRKFSSEALSQRLHEVRLERAIGVIYRPETERASHYFRACLADQFDEYVWVDETHAVRPLSTKTVDGMPDTYPFGV